MHSCQRSLLRQAVNQIGLQPLAAACGVKYTSVSKWIKNGLPRKCYSGEKNYHHVIERLTNGQIKAADLLSAPRSKCQQ